MNKEDILQVVAELCSEIDSFELGEKVNILNSVRSELHKHSPFKAEPVDFVKWVKVDEIKANDYNPNSVAPPEMELLKTSILQDGYTQPIVSWVNKDMHEVVDGFHRNRVGIECEEVKEKIKGYLPLTIINPECEDRGNRIASTIRHNRARGKHRVDSMSDIVIELKNRNWKNKRIAKELGMDEDEILRLCQITGLSDLFSDEDFSKSWNVDDSEEEFMPLVGEVGEDEKEEHGFRTVNTGDENRIFHVWQKWECYKAGFYATTKEGLKKEDGEQEYCNFLSDEERFRKSLEHVITEWKNSCEHYLTNIGMNRIAWLGQASMCFDTGIPYVYRSGFYLLTDEQQNRANKTAWEYLNKWLAANGMDEISLEEALTNKQVSLY